MDSRDLPPRLKTLNPATPSQRSARRRRLWLTSISIAAVTAILTFLAVTETHVTTTSPSATLAQPLVRPDTAPQSSVPTTTGSVVGAPARCSQDPPGTAQCFPVTPPVVVSALTRYGYRCTPDGQVRAIITCDQRDARIITHLSASFES